MTIATMIELAVAALLILGAILLYRRKPAREEGTENVDHYGSQGAVLLLVVGVILLIHGTGQLEYHPSAAELEAAQ